MPSSKEAKRVQIPISESEGHDASGISQIPIGSLPVFIPQAYCVMFPRIASRSETNRFRFPLRVSYAHDMGDLNFLAGRCRAQEVGRALESPVSLVSPLKLNTYLAILIRIDEGQLPSRRGIASIPLHFLHIIVQ